MSLRKNWLHWFLCLCHYFLFMVLLIFDLCFINTFIFFCFINWLDYVWGFIFTLSKERGWKCWFNTDWLYYWLILLKIRRFVHELNFFFLSDVWRQTKGWGFVRYESSRIAFTYRVVGWTFVILKEIRLVISRGNLLDRRNSTFSRWFLKIYQRLHNLFLLLFDLFKLLL